MTFPTPLPRRAIALPLVFALAGCSYSQTPAPVVAQAPTESVRISNEANVEGCTFLGLIAASRYSGFLFAGRGLQKAREQAIKDAEAVGATDLVFTTSNTGVVQTVEGNAYRCTA